MKNPMLAIALLLALSITLTSCDKDEDTIPEIKTFTLHAVGTATATPIDQLIPGTEQEVSGISYTMDFFDKETGELLGSLTDINVSMDNQPDGTVIAEGFPIFTFQEDGSTLSLHNFVLLQPLEAGIMSATYEPAYQEKNIISGTGRFAGARGQSILSATLDVTQMEAGIITFDCIYMIELD